MNGVPGLFPVMLPLEWRRSPRGPWSFRRPGLGGALRVKQLFRRTGPSWLRGRCPWSCALDSRDGAEERSRLSRASAGHRRPGDGSEALEGDHLAEPDEPSGKVLGLIIEPLLESGTEGTGRLIPHAPGLRRV